MDSKIIGHIPERRTEPRIRTLLTARVVLPGRHASYDGVMRNASPSGAMIVIPETTPVPAEFLLYTPRHDEWQAAERIWRHGEHVGLALKADEAEAERRDRAAARLKARRMARAHSRPKY